jgi:hypothetical protein
MPWVFRNTPTDISRIGALLEALRDPRADPRILVFGNSVIMAGIDGGQLRDELPGRPLAWNLASSGQTLVQSVLLAQEAPASVRIVLYTLQLRSGVDETPLSTQVYNTFYMFGFRPSRQTLETIGRVHGTAMGSVLARSHVAQLFEARWAVRQFADTQLRILLRRDLALATAATDLLHPQPYLAPFAPALVERMVAVHRAALEEHPPTLPPADRELVAVLAAEAAARGRRSVFLLPPVHPAIRAPHRAAFDRAVAEVVDFLAEQPGALAIDATAALPAADFFDDEHPTDSGARVLTHLVAQRIAAWP